MVFHCFCNDIIASHFEVVNPSDMKHAAKLFPVPDSLVMLVRQLLYMEEELWLVYRMDG